MTAAPSNLLPSTHHRRLRLRLRRTHRAARADATAAAAPDSPFIGDTARLPYGSKSRRTIARYAAQSAQFLVEEQGAEFLVIACNTASALALDAIQDAVPVPVLGVIEPGAAAARAASQHRRCAGDRHRRHRAQPRLRRRLPALRVCALSRKPARCWCRWSKKAGPTIPSPPKSIRHLSE